MAAPPPAPAQPQLNLFAANEADEADSTRAAPAADNPLAWLESLAADGGGAGSALPALDLGDLAQPVVPDLSALSVGGQDDPMAWLESLSQGQNAIPGLDAFALDNLAAPAAPARPAQPVSPPAAQPADNPLEWLESLARRQGADSEELTTQAALDVPVPDPSLVNRGPGYTDYTFEAADSASDADALDFLSAVDSDAFDSDIFSESLTDEGEDTSDWLTALAAGQVPDAAPAPRTDVIQSALSQGADIPPDVMKVWMDQMLEQGASRNDVPDYVDEADDQIVPAQLPDWLIEQVGAPPEIIPAASSLPSTSPLVNQIVEPPAVDMPDWLREDISADSDPGMEDIFAFEDEALPPAAAPIAPTAPASVAKISTSELEMDTNDPWVEAFELERKLDDEEVPSWYRAKIAALENGDAEPSAALALAPAQLPIESELSLAEAQALPNWLDVREVGVTLGAAPTVSAPAAAPAPEPEPITPSVPDWLRDQMPDAEAAPAFSADMFLSEAVEVVEAEAGELPDWLREAGLSTDDEIEIPAWLTETLETNETPAVAPAASAPAPVVEAAPVPQPAASPAPVVPAAQINVLAMLTQARSTFQAGQLDEAVQAYEAVIRANAGLDDVVADLSGYIKADAHKSNPALYRVLGDGLMRQGKLQQALDTYRKALNLL
jgi:tetratricopeptide (TPR) repeat protein